MPSLDSSTMEASSSHQEEGQPLTRLPFPPLRRSHILHCSYHYWYPKYRSITPKARVIPLTKPFLDYLRADGIILPSDADGEQQDSDDDSGIFSSAEANDVAEDDDDDEEDVSTPWRDVHERIRDTIKELGGKVVPKLNWSAPKDATWISATNGMDCRTASDVYLLLKSSDFVTHDLEHAFDDCVDGATGDAEEQDEEMQYVLALRKFVQLNPSVEFRCFVRRRKLLGICQRDLNHYDFLAPMVPQLKEFVQDFFDDKLRDTFPDDNFTFDVYIPPPHEKVWLVDFNPWDQRTDPLLFSWLEILTRDDPVPMSNDENHQNGAEDDVVRLRISNNGQSPAASDASVSEDDESDIDEDLNAGPEFRLVNRDDPEAYLFNSTRYSAHKMPKDVVDASQAGSGGLREFAENWKDILAKRQQANEQHVSDSEAD